MTARVFAAIDLGASSGRVMAGIVEREAVSLHLVHRFPNGPRAIDGHLRWDLSGLFAEVRRGLARLAHEYPQVESIGVDTWGVDYGLLDADGGLLAEPVSHRDPRTSGVIEGVHAQVPREELYGINGLQFLPFNTLYQLAAEREGELWEKAVHVVMLPDLLAYWLTGGLRTELTNASTTGLLDVRSRQWSRELLRRLDIPIDRLPPLEAPGAIRGPLRPHLRGELGLPSTAVVTTVGSHDTASAVVGVPASSSGFAYVSSGTWSLVGLELDEPILTAAARRANFTNEGGVDGRTRFLRNVGGLWLMQECLGSWAAGKEAGDAASLLAAAGALPPDGPRIDVDDPTFLAPGGMPERIGAAAARAGRRPPRTPAETIRCIIDSLAAAYAATVGSAAELAGAGVEVIHIIGGGSQNTLLCQLTADTAELPVIAGPVEATALGNVVVQARAHGALPRSLEQLRAQVAAATSLRRFEPRGRSM